MRLSPRHIEEIGKLQSGRTLQDFPLSRLSSFKIGGPADLVVEPRNTGELAAVVRYLRDEAIPRLVLGGGTNVLFRDAGFRGVIVRMNALNRLDLHPNGSDHARIVSDAGVPLPSVLNRVCRLGWTGLEPLWGIPGTFGGAVVSNAGAGGASICDFLVELSILTDLGEEILLKRADLNYGYRCMDLPRKSVVLGGTLRLERGESEAIEAALENARSRRREKQPGDQASAGCIFKNPSPEDPAGAVIDRLGFKGMTVGGAEVSRVHANFIVNRGGASATDVLALIEKIRGHVKEREHIDLELEIRVVGEESAYD